MSANNAPFFCSFFAKFSLKRKSLSKWCSMPLTSCQAKSIIPIDPALGQAFHAAIMVARALAGAPPTVANAPSGLEPPKPPEPPPHHTFSPSKHGARTELA